jgi:hypothetical protein
VKGRRLSDRATYNFDEMAEGDIFKVLLPSGEPDRSKSPTNLTGFVWCFKAPGGAIGFLTKHTVREHDDGTVSVRQGDGSSNSILIQNPNYPTWHGYIDHNEWKETGN